MAAADHQGKEGRQEGGMERGRLEGRMGAVCWGLREC